MIGNVSIILPDGVNVTCDIDKKLAGVHNYVENTDEEGIHTVYIIGTPLFRLTPAEFLC